MCGFVGFTGDIDGKEPLINTMMDKIIHRGPDSSGIFSNESVTLGFRRLSIIDLSDEGTQPMFNEDKTIAIVFNGEIYNYQALRSELIEKGHVFSSLTDTETLVHLYEEYGYKMLDKLRGMFAFVIYDTKKEELFAARDFFGIKPFYYTNCNGHLVFGSEIKAFLEFPGFKKEVNLEALENYLSFQYSVLPETFFKNVFKLMPGHYMVYQPRDNRLTVEKYFSVEFNPNDSMTMEDAEALIDETIQESIKMHKISDVEVGSFLSSGVDSSYVAACFKGDKTFTVGFNYDNYNEISYAKALSEKIEIDNYSKTISTEEYWDVLPKVQYHMDEPLADPSAVALYFVSQTASQHVKVALSGEAADEFFGGYNIYKEPLALKPIQVLPRPILKALSCIVSLVPFKFKGKSYIIRGAKPLEKRFIGNAYMFTASERKKVLKSAGQQTDPSSVTKSYYEKAASYDDITKMQYIDIHLWMVGDILLKADKMSMAHSLEVRVPYVDKEVFKTASKIPTSLRVNKSGTKLAFRKAAGNYLPPEVASKKKLGFPVPIRVWLKEDKYYNIIKTAFTSKAAEEFFSRDYIIRLLDRHKAGKEDNSRKIWTIYMFLLWHEQYFCI